jgi:hypothetical protein
VPRRTLASLVCEDCRTDYGTFVTRRREYDNCQGSRNVDFAGSLLAERMADIDARGAADMLSVNIDA